MNNNSKDIIKDSKMLDEFLQAFAAGNVIQEGKSINDITELEANKLVQCEGASFHNIAFNTEQLKYIANEYQKKIDMYKKSVEQVFSKRADYDKALNEIRLVYNKLHECEQKISEFVNKGIENLNNVEIKKLENLYNERIKFNEQYVDYQQGLILFIHADENGLGEVTNSEIALRNYVNPEIRTKLENEIICSESFVRDEPFFDVSAKNNEINNLKNKIKLVSGKLTNFTRNMFDKMNGKFVPRKDGVLAKLSGFTQKFIDKNKLEKNVHLFTKDMIVNDTLSLYFNSMYRLEKNRIKNEENCARLTSDEIAALIDRSISRNAFPPEILEGLNPKVFEYLEEINSNMNKSGLSSLQAINNTVHFSQADYNKKKDLLTNYAKASNKLFKKELNDFKEKIKDLNLSDLKDETAIFDVRVLPNPEAEMSEKTKSDEQVNEPVIIDVKENTAAIDTKPVESYASSQKDETVSDTEPLKDTSNSDDLSTSSQPVDADLDNENEQNAELAKNEDAHSDEPVFVTATKNYITVLENERTQLLQEYDERKKELRAALERANAKKIKYGDRVPEINEDPVVVAIQNEVNEIGKRMEKIADDIEHEETKLEELKNKQFLSKVKLNEKSMVIDDYNNVIEGLENDLKTHSTNHQNYFEPDKASNNSGRTSEFGPVEDTMDEDLANDRELNEYRSNLNILQEEMNALKSDNITDILNHFEDMENAINNNANLSNEDKAEARKQLWENFAEYTATTDEENYKPRSR